MRKPNKKGFTIVELVIVIAVVAILAAVLIPTFVSVTNKAKQSADIQACRQMNTYLAVNEVTDGKTIKEVYNTLEEGGMSAENYKPLSKDTYYFWDKDLNRVLYTDKDYKVTFPEEYKNVTKNDHQWYSLSGKISTEKIEKGTDGNYNINRAEQLMYLSEQNLSGNTTITLSASIDLMGAQIKFKAESGSHVTIKPASDTAKTEIKGFVNSESIKQGIKNYDENKKYGAALIPEITNGSVTIENITIDGASVGAYDIGGTAFLVGTSRGSDITIKNVVIKNSNVYGMNKVGAFVGSVGVNTVKKSIITIENSSLDNVNIYCSEGEAGKYFGGCWDATAELPHEITLTNVTDNNVTVNLNEQEGREYVKEFSFADGTPEPFKKVEVLCQRLNGNVPTDEYRAFCSTALFMYQGSVKLTVNNTVNEVSGIVADLNNSYKPTKGENSYTLKNNGSAYVYEA